MEAVVCRRVGRMPRSLDGGSGGDEKTASLAVQRDLPSPCPPEALASSGLWVRIRIAAASLNFADVLTVLGKYQERPPLPFIPGAEVSGIVTEVGPAVQSVRVGDRVCAVVGTGGFASQVITEERRVFILPENCDLAAAAALPVAYGTAHLALAHRANLQPGQVLLVLGAAGGVGLAAVQLGKLLGARVIAVARGAEKAAVLRQAGADCVVDSSATSVRDGVKAQLKDWGARGGGGGKGPRGSSGVDVVFDAVGGEQFEDSLKVLAWGGQVLVIGFASGQIPSIPANIALVKNLTVHGIYWGSYMDRRPSVLRDSMAQLLRWLADGSITIQVSHRVPLDQVLQAFGLILRREAIGKVLVVPSGSSKL